MASHPELVPSITSAGLTAAPCGVDHEAEEVARAALPVFTSTQAELFGTHTDALDGDFLASTDSVLVLGLHANVNADPLVDDMVEFARSWRPDLVLWDPFSFAGAAAASASGAAHARVLWGPDMLLHLRQAYLARSAGGPDRLRDRLSTTLDRFGLEFTDDTVTG